MRIAHLPRQAHDVDAGGTSPSRCEPNGLPGYLRVDSVHQGDRDGVKGIYLVNLVDEVTQASTSAPCGEFLPNRLRSDSLNEEQRYLFDTFGYIIVPAPRAGAHPIPGRRTARDAEAADRAIRTR